MNLLRVFVDSDVVISSLISQKGAAHFLLGEKISKVKFYISNFSFKEQKTVVERLKINQKKFQDLVKKRFAIIRLKTTAGQIKRDYQIYTTDPNDAHIVAGAEESKAKFLITYNQRHFKGDKIRNDLNILLLTPAQFLQYLRSEPPPAKAGGFSYACPPNLRSF